MNGIYNRRNYYTTNKVKLVTLWSFSIWFPRVEVFGLGINDLIAFSFIIITIPSVFLGRSRLPVIGHNLLFLFSILVAISLLQVAWVQDPTGALRFSLRYMEISLLILSVATIHNLRNMIEPITLSFVLGGALVSIICILDVTLGLLGGYTYEQTSNRRSLGFLEHPNQLGIFLSIALILSFNLKVSTLVRCALISCIVFGVVISGSKTNLILCLISICVVPILARGFSFRSTSIQAIVICVVYLCRDVIVSSLIWTVRAFNDGYAERFSQAMLDPASASTMLERYDLWDKSIQLGVESPFSGVGAGQAYLYLPYSHAHNFILHYFMTLGILGAFCIIAALISIMAARPFEEKFSFRRLKLAVLVFSIANLFSDSIAGRSIDLLGYLSILAVLFAGSSLSRVSVKVLHSA